MVKPSAPNMTITLHQSGGLQSSVKPLVIGEQIIVHTNATAEPILPHQPVAAEQDHQINPLETLLQQTGVTLKKSSGSEKLRDFAEERLALLSNRYHIKRD
jgi:hypothetical protein